MDEAMLNAVPPAWREQVRSALDGAFDGAALRRLAPVAGGASGALILRVESDQRAHLMRLEGPASQLLPRNPHRYVCTRIAAEIGVAPAIRYLDEAHGVIVTDFIDQRPLSLFPGGPLALSRALGGLLAQLQDAASFPQLVYYPDLVTRMLHQLRDRDIFADGLIDPHFKRLASLRVGCDWDATPTAASHNDPNPANILFDGERLWMIDWESAYRNDPMVDLAIVLDGFASTPELEVAVVEAWLGRAPDQDTWSRLAVTRALTRLYYACFLFGTAADTSPLAVIADLKPMSLQQLREAVGGGRLKATSAQAMSALGALFLEAFMTDVPSPGLWDAAALGAASAVVGGEGFEPPTLSV